MIDPLQIQPYFSATCNADLMIMRNTTLSKFKSIFTNFVDILKTRILGKFAYVDMRTCKIYALVFLRQL